MAMNNSILRLFIDSIALLASIAIIQYGFVYVSFDNKPNMDRIIYGSLVGFLTYFVCLSLFTRVWKRTQFLPTLNAVLLGSVLWIAYHLVLAVKADSYLSDHPEAFYDRLVRPGVLAFGILVPLFTVIVLGLILLGRVIARLNSKSEAYE